MLYEQVTQLQLMVDEFKKEHKSPNPTSKLIQNQQRKKFRGFCYKCGLDGHVMHQCTSEANPTLVQEKLCAQSEAGRQHKEV